MRVTTKTEAAAALGVSPRTIERWTRLGAPGTGAEGFDTEALAVWRDQRLLPPNRAGPATPSPHRERLVKAMADEKELKVRRAAMRVLLERGQMISIEKMRERDIARIHAIKRGLLMLVHAAPPRLVGENEQEMTEILRKMTFRLFQRFRQMSVPPDGSPACPRCGRGLSAGSPQP